MREDWAMDKIYARAVEIQKKYPDRLVTEPFEKEDEISVTQLMILNMTLLR